jgi:hypothetical protein
VNKSAWKMLILALVLVCLSAGCGQKVVKMPEPKPLLLIKAQKGQALTISGLEKLEVNPAPQPVAQGNQAHPAWGIF